FSTATRLLARGMFGSDARRLLGPRNADGFLACGQLRCKAGGFGTLSFQPRGLRPVGFQSFSFRARRFFSRTALGRHARGFSSRGFGSFSLLRRTALLLSQAGFGFGLRAALRLAARSLGGAGRFRAGMGHGLGGNAFGVLAGGFFSRLAFGLDARGFFLGMAR